MSGNNVPSVQLGYVNCIIGTSAHSVGSQSNWIYLIELRATVVTCRQAFQFTLWPLTSRSQTNDTNVLCQLIRCSAQRSPCLPATGLNSGTYSDFEFTAFMGVHDEGCIASYYRNSKHSGTEESYNSSFLVSFLAMLICEHCRYLKSSHS